MALTRRHLDVAVLGLVLLLFTLLVRSWMREGSEVIPPSAMRSDAKPGSPLRRLEVLTSAQAGKAINLLEHIDLTRDRVAGDWILEKDALRSPIEKWARIQLPVSLPEEYDFSSTVTRLDKTDALILGAVVDGKQCQIVLDGNGGRGSWIEVKQGAHGISENGITYFEGPVFANGRPAEIVVAVRKGRLEVRIDGFQILVWRGSQGKLFVGENWDVPSARALFLGAWQSAFAFSRLELTAASGKVEILR